MARSKPVSRPATRRSRRLLDGSTLTIGIALAVALVAIVNYFGWKYHTRSDWTADQVFTLSAKSAGVVETLERDIEATVLMPETDSLHKPTWELLQQYADANSRFSSRSVDPALNPAEAARLIEENDLARGAFVILKSGDQRRVVDATDLAEFDYSGMQYGQPPTVVGYTGEQAITSAVLELVQAETPLVVFTTGHGERSLDDASPLGLERTVRLLTQDNLDLEEWVSLGATAVPEGTALLMVVGPSAGFVEQELEVFDRYLATGGRMLVLLDPALSEIEQERERPLVDWLARRSVRVGVDVTVDPEATLPLYSAETFFVDSFAAHPIVDPLSEARIPVLFSLARSVSVEAAGTRADGEWAAVSLFSTRSQGWGETGLAALDQVQFDAGDLAGPVSLAVVATASEAAATAAAGSADASNLPEARLMVVGDADWMSNEFVFSQGNPTFVANAVNWLLEREELVSIPSKRNDGEPLNLSSGALARMWWIFVVGVPLASLVIGGVTFYRRRR